MKDPSAWGYVKSKLLPYKNIVRCKIYIAFSALDAIFWTVLNPVLMYNIVPLSPILFVVSAFGLGAYVIGMECDHSYESYHHSWFPLKGEVKKTAYLHALIGPFTVLYFLVYRCKNMYDLYQEYHTLKSNKPRLLLYKTESEEKVLLCQFRLMRTNIQKELEDVGRKIEQLEQIKSSLQSTDIVDPTRWNIVESLLEKYYLCRERLLNQDHETASLGNALCGEYSQLKSLLEADVQLYTMMEAHQMLKEIEFSIEDREATLVNLRSKQQHALEHVQENVNDALASFKATHEVLTL